MLLSQLLSIYPELFWGHDPHREVAGLTNDSRLAKAGWVYVAIRGTRQDGHQFLASVCAQDVAAVVVEDRSQVPGDFLGAVAVVPSTRVALDELAAQYYGRPAERLFCVGVTGTNGKTSITYMVEAIFSRFGWETGVIGTINHHIGAHVWESELTTPDPLTLHKRLAEFRALSAEAVAFEVSSHALHQHRVDDIPFDVAVFTNLTRDHLDYHATMESYFASKERFFRDILSRSRKPQVWAVINGDDDWGRRLQVADRARIWTYGQGKNSDLRFRLLEQNFAGTRFFLQTPRGDEEIFLPATGLHNVYNASAAIAVGLAAGVSLTSCREAMATFRGVPGRLQRVDNGRGLHIFVDYAHTDDALRVVLTALDEVRQATGKQSRIITVFGCGGDRDQGKRPLMAEAAVAGSDLVFITSDNPRTEDPPEIIRQICQGVPKVLLETKVFCEVDRRQAIGRALQSAEVDDVILIAGKGHENYQIIGEEKRPFSDVEAVLSWLK